MVAAAAAIRGAAVALSGMVLAAAISLVLWALTPASGADATSAAKAGVAGFAAANLMPVTIGGVVLSVPPLLLTILIVALIVVTSRRGRFLPVGRDQETAAVLVTAAGYGLLVAVTTRAFAPDGVVAAGWVWTATALALVATAGAVLSGRSAWRIWWQSSVAGWFRVGSSAAGIGLGVVIAGGGLALTVAMIAHFGSIVGVGALAAPSWTDGLGMALLGAAYVPNAVVAAVGYISGVGFEIGSGSYSPFAANTVDLPALPLLAAAPDHPGRSLAGLAFLAVPLLAGYLMARRVSGDLGCRSERVLAVGSAAVLTGVLLGCLTWLARGGIGNGPWSTIGAPPLLVAAVVAVELAAVAVATAALVGARTVPWRPVVLADATVAVEDLSEETGPDSDGSKDDELDADTADAGAESAGDMPGEPADADSTEHSDAAREPDATEQVDAQGHSAQGVEVQPQLDSVDEDAAADSPGPRQIDTAADPRSDTGAEAFDGEQSPAAAQGVSLPHQRAHTDDAAAAPTTHPDEAAAAPTTGNGGDAPHQVASAESGRRALERAGHSDEHEHAGRQQ